MLRVINAALVIVALTSTNLLIRVEAQSQGNQGANKVLSWLPQCFKRAEGVEEVVACVEENANPQCVEGEGITAAEIVQCIQDSISLDDAPEVDDAGGRLLQNAGQGQQNAGQGQQRRPRNFRKAFKAAALECLDPYVTCVQETVRERLESLPSCVNQTLRELRACGRENRATCKETCAGSRPIGNPYENVTATSLATCNGVQENLVDPTCEIVNCCEPCVSQYEDLINCVVNDVLEEVPITGQACNLVCATSSRQLRFVQTMQESVVVGKEFGRDLQSQVEESSECLEFTPGLTGSDSLELEARSEVFLPCVYEDYLDNIAATDDSSEETGDDEDTSSSHAAVLASSIVLAALGRGLFTFLTE